ncbi:MAG TPA: hypothetical protein VFR15_07425 [Chloroflexia bacterium]|nr:hypothetical protein [Chloroflexia bacterium]
MKRRLLIIPTLLLSALFLTGCLGPDPVLESFEARPPQDPNEPFLVEAVVRNASTVGEGEILVEVTLNDRESGEVIRREAQTVTMQSGETERVLFELSLPPSAQEMSPDRIEVEVEAHYPIY